MPLLPAFLRRYPDITVDLVLRDQVVDLLDDRADIAIRTGPLNVSSLIMRRLGGSRMVVVAAPSYIEREGVPKTPKDLNQHNQLGFGFNRHLKAWPFEGEQEAHMLPPSGNLLVSDGEAMRTAAIAGLGVARLALFHVKKTSAVDGWCHCSRTTTLATRKKYMLFSSARAGNCRHGSVCSSNIWLNNASWAKALVAAEKAG